MSAARDAALVRVQAKAASAQAPAVEDAIVAAFLDSCGLTDANGLTPADDDWDGPWDESLAIAEVWSTKAASVAGMFNFSADGASYNKGDLLAHFLEMEQKFRDLSGAAGGMGTIQVTGTNDPYVLDTIAARVIP